VKAASLIIALALAVNPAFALTNDEIANYKGADRQKVLEEGAKKEGKVAWYTSLIVDQATKPIEEGFKKKYPFLQVDTIRGDSTQILSRSLAEARAHNVHMDVIAASLAGAFKKGGIAQVFDSPILAEYPKSYIDPDHTYVTYRTSFLGIAWNTKLVSKEDAPKSYDDLLNPKWKGKMVWSQSPETGGPFMITYFRLTRGEDKGMEFLKKLQGQQVKTLSGSVRTILDQVIAGEYPIGIGMAMSHVAISLAAGAPVAAVSPSPMFARSGTINMVKDAPHPYAAMLLIDYVLSKDGGQAVMRDAQYNPAHPQVDTLPELLWTTPKATHAEEIVENPMQMDEITPKSMEIYQTMFR
jgi:iron(III) transport system substrate-binding protein